MQCFAYNMNIIYTIKFYNFLNKKYFIIYTIMISIKYFFFKKISILSIGKNKFSSYFLIS